MKSMITRRVVYAVIVFIAGILLFLLVGGCYIENIQDEGYVALQIKGETPKALLYYDVDFAFFYPENIQWNTVEEIYLGAENEEEILANAVPIRGLPKLTITLGFGETQMDGVINVDGIPAGIYQMILHTADDDGTYMGFTETSFTIEAGKTTTVPLTLKGPMEFLDQ